MERRRAIHLHLGFSDHKKYVIFPSGLRTELEQEVMLDFEGLYKTL
jgi:hypothetical protein